jgi:hypothetical protein
MENVTSALFFALQEDGIDPDEFMKSLQQPPTDN